MVIYRQSNLPWTESGLEAIRAFMILRPHRRRCGLMGIATQCPAERRGDLSVPSRSPEDIFGPIIPTGPSRCPATLCVDRCGPA